MKTVALIKECNSWSSFQSLLEACNNKEKGDAFELLTKLYFKLNPIYDFYDEVWLLDEVPQKDLDVLKLPSQDLGIDLIAKNGSEYHAIQCKYHSDKNQNVTFTEVSTFLQLIEANKKITLGYICSSANGMSKNYHKVQKKQVQEILVDTWQKLDGGFFDKARKLLLNKRVKDKPLTPYKHQKKAIRDAKKHFLTEDNDRGKLIFPCGSGKSLTGYWITEALGSNSTLIAVPSLSLVKQTLEVYLREIVAHEINVKWLCICSDEGIGKDSEVLVKTQDIGVPCLTDVDYISNWLEEHRNDKTIIFTTYQSGRIIAEVSKRLKFKFDVGIFDEAHKTVGSKNKVFSHLLFEENIDIKKRIFMTATERFYRGRKDEIISMDEIGVYGETFAYLSFKEAIEQELLTDYKVITIDIKKSEIADFIKENNLVQLNDKWNKDTEARSLASMLAMRKAMKHFNIKNVVSFHSSIEKAKRYKDLQGYITKNYNYKPIDTYTVSGKIPTSKRNNIVQEFANSKRALITNARCLTEGIDVPNIDCIVFADPRKSKVDIVQALGRALRKKKGKDWGYVILPVVYDEEKKEIDNESYNEVVSVLSSLASNDERIIEYFKAKSQPGNAKNDIVKGSDLFTVDSSMLDEKEFASQLEIKMWSKLSQFNWMPFEEARNYMHSKGLQNYQEWIVWSASKIRPINIPSSPAQVYKNEGYLSLGDWLGTGNIAPKYMYDYWPFKKARSFVHKLGLTNQEEWTEYLQSDKRSFKIPGNPARIYKNNGWINLGDWLGTGRVATREMVYRPFKDARKFARSLGLTTQVQWFDYCKSSKKPDDIPTSPRGTYKDQFTGFGDWLGTEKVANQKRNYKSFNDAREYSKRLKLSGKIAWEKWSADGNRPMDIPGNPRKTYKGKGWIGWSDWLGTGNLHPSQKKKLYCDFKTARTFVRKLKLNSHSEYNTFCKSDQKPDYIPPWPQQTYNVEWINWYDYLGKSEN
jgi:superfamily II DNA or RNA helicase